VSKSRRCWLAVCQVSCHRSFHTPLRKASMGFTFVRSHRMPEPLRRASTTSLLALSTIPEPIGQPARRKKWRAHQGQPFAQIAQMLANLFPAAFALRQTIGETEEGVWATMFEDV